MSNDLELFDRFNTEMYKEYVRHLPKNGDSWKDCGFDYLYSLLLHSIEKQSFAQLKENPSHFIDIANFALFCYYRFNEFHSPSTSESSTKGEIK